MSGAPMSREGQTLLEAREGCRLEAYRDTRGVLTIGYGHTSMAGLPKVMEALEISAQEASEIFARDLVQYMQCVDDFANGAKLTANERDALGSLCYNIGMTEFRNSTVARILRGAITTHALLMAAHAILLFDKPSEIIARRHGEYMQFLTRYT